MNTTPIELNVNGNDVVHNAPADITLADFLHEKLGLTGTKVSCAMGICKACTVAVRAPGQKHLERMQACLMPATALQNHRILTVEGIAQGEQLSAEQIALLRHFSFQCGYCAPGFLMGIVLLVDKLKAKPAHRHELPKVIEENLGQHICRCSGYVKYHEAITALLLTTPGLVIG
ncbi:MAG: 2Fe-2S iron-sulfur cluster-binding protein [Burkholderiaceae bacterium]|nr:2Fe-2S iron-sulfur cluster-binding protein [Burkholderiaceae bacterium]